ncbi:MAG: lectin-like protein [Planctomycetota bacterium]
MRLATFLSLLLSTATLSAQTTVLSEDFAGAVPPAGWINVNNNGNPTIGWQAGTNPFNGMAWHDDESIADSDNVMVSPIMDFTGLSNVYLHFESETQYTQWMANHPSSIGDGVSTMEITTNGGLTWTVVWTDTAQVDYVRIGPTVDLSAWAGQSNVQLGIHLYGTYDQSWWVDNVIIDDQPVPVLTTITNPNNGHPYFLLGQSDFGTAQAMANELGGSLVSIDSAAENSWLLSNFGNFGGSPRNLLLGLNDVALEGSFEWVSGEALTYTNWTAGEPNNGGTGEDFVQMVSGGRWNDYDGSGAHGVVEISQARIRTTPLIAGQLATITVNGLRVGSSVIMVFSTNGAGPTATPYGVIAVDPDMITPTFPAISGQFNFSTYVPSALSGSTLYGQAIQFNADNTTDLSDAFSAPIQ